MKAMQLGFALVLVSSPLVAQTDIRACETIGESQTVCGEIACEHTATNSRGTPTFINDKAYPN